MSKIIYQEKNGVAIISVDRPEALNALNREIIDDLEKRIDDIAENENIRVLVIGGAENFAAGADIKGMVECDPEEAKAFTFNSCYNKIMNLSIPSIAAIDGYALGGGMELALCCDLRIAAETAKVGFPEINLGIMPGAGGTIRTPRLIGYAKACELILMGNQVSAAEAEMIGLVNLVVPKEQLMETAMKWAEKLAKKAPVALAAAKKMIRTGLTMPTIEEGVAYEADAWAKLFSTEDQKEGMRAFLEKRKPEFLGK